MSPIPQRKKSAEELMQLRDELGIRTHAAGQPQKTPHTDHGSPLPPPPRQEPSPLPAPGPKPVRSLKRSEREPSPQRLPPRPSSFSKIPARRHKLEEIEEMRRRDALSRFSVEEHPLPFPLPAPLWIVIPGYLFAVAGFACHYWTEIPISMTVATACLAWLVVGYLLLRRPLSRHHAGFIAITTVFALVFAALHYFPHLRHAS